MIVVISGIIVVVVSAIVSLVVVVTTVCIRSVWILRVVTTLTPSVVSIWMHRTVVCGLWTSLSLVLFIVRSAGVVIIVIPLILGWSAVVSGIISGAAIVFVVSGLISVLLVVALVGLLIAIVCGRFEVGLVKV